MKKRKKFKKGSIFVFIFLIINYISSFLLIKSIGYFNSSKSFMSKVFYISIVVIFLIAIISTLYGINVIKKNRKNKYIRFYIYIVLLISLEIFLSFNINKVTNSITKFSNSKNSYSTSLVALKSSKLNSIKDLKDDTTIGMINDENNKEAYIIPLQIIEDKKINEDNIKYYDSFEELLNDLYDEKIDTVFLSSSYVSMFSTLEGFENIKDDTKVLYEKIKNATSSTKKTSKTLNEPFTLLIMGVDSDTNSLEKSSSFNGDTLILITFNPNTMNATILSIPRDTRVPIVCTKYKSKNKINSAAYYGASCVTDTISSFTGINIDYWVKVNFQAVVKLVDAVGGIEIDVPYAFCEQNSKRQFGSNTIYVEKGLQNLNGEQALAYARNRHTWPFCGKKYSNYVSNDFIRGQHQQEIINALINKLKSVRKINEIYDILDIIGDNIDSNIDKDTMITAFDTFKNIISKSRNIKSNNLLGTQKLYLNGSDNMIGGIYYYEYSVSSLKQIINAMKINLELIEPKMDKDFSFSINEPYVEKQIGK